MGQTEDVGSGLTYLNNRYYDPSIGEFISVDPLVSKTGDPYLYAAGNPTTLSDPNGLEPGCGATQTSSTSCGQAHQHASRPWGARSESPGFQPSFMPALDLNNGLCNPMNMKTGCGLTAQGVLDRIVAGSLKPMIQLPYSPEMIQYQVLRAQESLLLGYVDLDDGRFYETNRWSNEWLGIGFPIDSDESVSVRFVTGILEVNTQKRYDSDRIPMDHFSRRAEVLGFVVTKSSSFSVTLADVSPDPDMESSFNDPTNDVSLDVTSTQQDVMFFPIQASSWQPISSAIWSENTRTWMWAS